jgi:adhesin/invasin
MHAENPQSQLVGDQQISGGLASRQEPPAFDATGVVGIFGGTAHTPLAPGGIISIFGDRLAESTAQSSSFPLPSILVDTQVFMAGVKLPLYYVSQTQINAIVPFKIGVNVPQQLLVQRGLTYSLPLRVDLAPTQPDILNSGPPQFAGVIYAYPAAGGLPYLVSLNAPAHVGDTVVLYCSGLGTVSPEVPDGAAAATNSTATNNVQLTIDDQAANVTFQGLVPGYAGLYQVNAVVPAGVSPGAAVNVTLSTAGQISPPVTIAIQ